VLLFFALTLNFNTSAQIGVGDDTTLDDMGDTFSVVAWDTVNNEAATAGTSCVGFTIDFLGDLIFDGSNNIIGAINSQAAYNATMQARARVRMEAGDTPDEIITWLQNNDDQSGGQQARQYGVVGSDGAGGFDTAGHTGTSNSSYANHLGGNIDGIYYSIQGNILLNADVLNDMETAFRNSQGSLTDRMMAALNGAKRVGGDNRCTTRGNSGRASFIKARRQGEATNYLDLTLGPVADGVEPIDELQCLYDNDPAIDTPLCVNTISSFPYTMNFEDYTWLRDRGSCGTDNIAWIRTPIATPSNSTGPSSANQGTLYAFIEATGNGQGYPNKTAIMSSPCFELPFNNTITFSFDYHMFGAAMGTLRVEANDGSGWVEVFTQSGDQGNAWVNDQTIDLTQYHGQTLKLRFNGTTGTNFTSDMAVDDIRLTVSDGITCNSTATFTGGAWAGGVTPTLRHSVVINDDYDTATFGNIEACSIVINSNNTLTVNAGGSISSANNIETQANATLTIEHQGSVLQYDRDALVVNNGNINTEVTTPSVEGRDFIIMGSPMTAETREGVFGSAFRVRQHLTAQFEPHPDVTLQFGDAINFADINTNTTVNGTNHTGLLNPGEGYVIRPQVNGAPAATFDYTHTLGTLNNGDITFNMIMGFDGTQNGSPNVMANPYASAISANAFMAANNLETLYFWEHNTQPSPAFPGQYVANFTMDDISMINSAGVGNPAATGGSTPTDVLASMQGFAVKADAARPVTFTNNMRLVSANNTLRSTDLEQRDIVRLNVSSIDYVKGATTTLAFLAEGSAGYDQGLDSKRMANIVSLYSHLEDGSKAFGIQTRELFSDNVKIPIGFSTLIEEETAYRITMSDVLGANLTNATAYLIDVYEGTTTNLNETDYEFSSKDGRFDARFILQFKNENILNTSEEILEDIALFPNPTNGILNVIAPQRSISEINIYDVQGRKVMSKSVDSEDRTEVNISELTNAIYFINVTTDNGSFTKRIIKN